MAAWPCLVVRRIGVLTSDFALYHDLVHLLRERHVAFTSLAFGERPDPSVGVILTSWRDSVAARLPVDVPVVVVPPDATGRDDLDGAVAQALRVLEGVPGYRQIVVGIDPGQRPGVAVVADGRLLHTSQVFRVRDVGPLVAGLLEQYPHERAVIRIGHGSPRERDVIVAALWARQEDGVQLEIVDETGTTPETGTVDWPSDIAAAIEIARTPGKPPAKLPRSRPSTGQIREVQRASRVASEGRVTLSRDAAARVARGEASLDDALRAAEDEARARPRNRPLSRRGSKG